MINRAGDVLHSNDGAAVLSVAGVVEIKLARVVLRHVFKKRVLACDCVVDGRLVLLI